MFMKRSLGWLFLFAACASQLSIAQSNYVLVDMDPGGAAVSGSTTGFGHGGEVLGWVSAANPLLDGQPVTFGPTTFLALLPGTNHGTVLAGGDGVYIGKSINTWVSSTYHNQTYQVRWSGGVPTPISSLITSTSVPPSTNFLVVDTNRAGVIIGHGDQQVLQLNPDGSLVSLGGLVPGLYAQPTAINDDGVVVGEARVDNVSIHAFRWDGSMVDLHVAAQIPGPDSRAYDVNRFGVACGHASFATPQGFITNAARWDGTQATDLGNLGLASGSDYSVATAINDFGHIAGHASDGVPYSSTPFVWKNGQMTHLGGFFPPGWTITYVVDIDNAGRIACEGAFLGKSRPVLLVPSCGGTFTSLGGACPSSTGSSVVLDGEGCAQPGGDVAFVIEGGAPNGHGWLALGAGSGSIPVGPACALQIAPLFPILTPIQLDARGEFFLPIKVPANLPPTDVRVQAILIDAALPAGVHLTNAMRIQTP